MKCEARNFTSKALADEFRPSVRVSCRGAGRLLAGGDAFHSTLLVECYGLCSLPSLKFQPSHLWKMGQGCWQPQLVVQWKVRRSSEYICAFPLNVPKQTSLSAQAPEESQDPNVQANLAVEGFAELEIAMSKGVERMKV